MSERVKRILFKLLELVGRGVFIYCAVMGILWLLAVGLAGTYEVPLYILVGDSDIHLMGGGFIMSRLYLALGIIGLFTLLFLSLRSLVGLAKVVKRGSERL